VNCGEDLSHNSNRIEALLPSGTDGLRANSKLESSEFSGPVLGLILLRYSDHKFTAAEEERVGNTTGRPKIGPSDDQEKESSTCPMAPASPTCSGFPHADMQTLRGQQLAQRGTVGRHRLMVTSQESVERCP
jgi:hypothetical protein